MKRLLLVATGGTIASRPTEDGLTPAIDSEALLSYVPEIRDLCEMDTVQLFNLDSTNMNHTHWLRLAAHIRSVYDQYDGFVVTHGTDTMAYATAMLSYLIQNNEKPVVFTGAQKSIYARDTDARNNLIHAVLYAADPRAGGVTLVFDGKVILGTRARKTRTRSFNAFSSIDYPELAVIRGGRLRFYITEKITGPVRFYDRLDPRVFVLRLFPGMEPGIFDYLAEHYAAVIIESFGMGGIPYYDSEAFAEKLSLLIDRGVKVIITTQVQHEGSDMEVYRVGYRIKRQYELLEAYDMTTETVIAKTMWALAQTADEESFRRLFRTPVARDTLLE